jgi:hypothetical protein
MKNHQNRTRGLTEKLVLCGTSTMGLITESTQLHRPITLIQHAQARSRADESAGAEHPEAPIATAT